MNNENINKKDLYNIFILGIIFIITIVISFGHWGNLYVDNGREAYLPQLVLEGKILFKDIFGLYNPLSYQINALLYFIFGKNINILVISGIFNSFIIIFVIYFISRLFTNRYYSFLLSVFITTFFILRLNGCINYIFPYAYAFIYALSSMLISAFFGLQFIKNNKNLYLYLAYLFLGISVANKPDFLLCVIPLLFLFIKNCPSKFRDKPVGCERNLGVVTLKSEQLSGSVDEAENCETGLDKINIKSFCVSFVLFFIPFLLSWYCLFLQGFNIEDLKSYIVFLQNFFNTEEQKEYNTIIKSSYDIQTAIRIITEFIKSFCIILIPAFAIKLYKDKNKLLGIILFIIMLPFVYLVLEQVSINYGSLFSWACLISMVITIIAYKNKNDMFVFLGLFSILSCYRTHFILTDGNYAVYFTLLPIITVFLYLISNITNLKYNEIKKYSVLMLVVIGLISFCIQTYVRKLLDIEVNTNKNGTLYITKDRAIPFNSAVEWILKNTKSDDTVLMLPEGPMINFITKRPSNPLYYHLIPNHIKALGEENIVEGLRRNPPKYILINNVSYQNYGKAFICKDFGLNICNFVKNNYELKTEYKTINSVKNLFYIKIYELKK